MLKGNIGQDMLQNAACAKRVRVMQRPKYVDVNDDQAGELEPSKFPPSISLSLESLEALGDLASWL